MLDAAAPELKAIDVYETKPSAADMLKALTAPLQNHGFKPQVISASLGPVRGGVQPGRRRQGIRVGRGRAADGRRERDHVPGVQRRPGLGRLRRAQHGCRSTALGVNYPASSPWVTGVGGTNVVLDSANRIARQVVWNDTSLQPGAAGGGGFSVLFDRPSYQKGIVSRNARGVPDVSMLADIVPGYAIYCSADGDCVTRRHPEPG